VSVSLGISKLGSNPKIQKSKSTKMAEQVQQPSEFTISTTMDTTTNTTINNTENKITQSTYPRIDLDHQVEGLPHVYAKVPRFEIVVGKTWEEFNQKTNDLSCEGLTTFGDMGLIENRYFQYMVKDCPTDSGAGEELNVQFVFMSNFSMMNTFLKSIQQLLELGFALGELESFQKSSYVQKMVRRRLSRDDVSLRLFVDKNGDYVNIQKNSPVTIRDKDGKHQSGKIVDIFHETLRVAFTKDGRQVEENVMLDQKNVFSFSFADEVVPAEIFYIDGFGYNMLLNVGLRVIARDISKDHYEATIIKLYNDGKVRVHFEGWNSSNDEDITLASKRIYSMESASSKFTLNVSAINNIRKRYTKK